jgi:formiminotetrahydrofolate cyclodeaminase
VSIRLGGRPRHAPTIGDVVETVPSGFRDLTLAAFVERLASADPVPGGGSAAAVAGALGASLVAMVAALSEGRPRYAAHAGTHTRAGSEGRRLIELLLDLADQDAVAYGSFAAAMKLPRETDEERAARSAAMRTAARTAAEVPLACVAACRELLAAAESLAGRSNANAASDLAVAANLGEAAARGAAENVLINLPAMDDELLATELTEQVVGYLHDVQDMADQIRETVRSGTTRDPLPIEGRADAHESAGTGDRAENRAR